MKYRFFILILVIFNILYSQELRIKNNIIYLDGTAVARISSQKGEVSYSNLKGKLKFTSRRDVFTLPDNTQMNIGTVALPNGEFNELYLEDRVRNKGVLMGFSTGLEKYLTSFFVYGEIKLITPKGIDEEVLNLFVNGEKTSLRKKYIQRKKEQEELLKKEEQIAASYELQIRGNGDIFAEGYKAGEIVRVAYPAFNGQGVLLRYTISDLDNNVLATWDQLTDESFNSEEFKTWIKIDGKWRKTQYYLPYINNKSFRGDLFSIDQDPLAMDIVKKLFSKGITLGHIGNEILSHKNEEIPEKINDFKIWSVNIYDEPGYVIDKNGNKFEGLITALFESVENGMSTNSDIGDSSEYGKEVSVKYKNARGKEKTKSFKSKSGIEFCIVNQRYGDICYIGFKTGDTGSAIENLTSFSMGASTFLQKVYENQGYMLLKSPLFNEYLLKFPNKDRALLVVNSEIKMLKKFVQYSGCDQILPTDYNLQDVGSLKKMIDDYIITCKK